MANEKSRPTEIKLGDSRYVNTNCWLASNLGYPPAKRCTYCRSRFNKCLFFRYLLISTIVATLILGAAFIVEGKIGNLLAVSVIFLIVIYGYFFNESTEKIIEANFEQSRAKDALEELNVNLQKKVDAQTRHLKDAYETEKQAKESLQMLDEEKNQFLLTVQHHLRTPLTTMVNYADMLLAENFGKLPKKAKPVVEKFEGSTAGLIKMVNDFLDVTQFQMDKKTVTLKEGVNLHGLIEGILKDIELEAKNKGIAINVIDPKIDCFIKADETKLKAALTNIFDNAVKYTEKGSITISATREGDNVHIIVKDTGIGIPKERLSKIFDVAFVRGENAKKSFSVGRGIGLYLSGKIIKAHNGQVWVESEGEGTGSVFNIVLPLSKTPLVVSDKKDEAVVVKK